MGHMTAINASMFSDLSFVYNDAATYEGSNITVGGTTLVSKGSSTVGDVINLILEEKIPSANITSVCQDFFRASVTGASPVDGFTENCLRIRNVREFPAMGTPPNIVNVPVYGQKTSQQIQGQADAPSLEIQINYVADDWADVQGKLGYYVGKGDIYLMRFAMMSSDPVTYDNDALGSVKNTIYYFLAKLEAMQVTPQLTDANTCTLTLSLQSDFYGPTTVD